MAFLVRRAIQRFVGAEQNRCALKVFRVDAYEDRTTATASFRTLSPKSKAYRSTSTCSSLKMARTVTAEKGGYGLISPY